MRDESQPIEEETRVNPDGVEVLDERYPDEGPERRPPPRRARRTYGYEEDTNRGPDLISLLAKGEIGMGEAWLFSDMIERRDARRARGDQTPTAAEAIATAVTDALEKAGLTGKPSGDDMPEWAKTLNSKVDSISNSLEEDTKKKESAELIEKATKPLKDLLEREQEQRKLLEEKVDKLGNPPPNDAKTGIDGYLDYQTKLKNAGFLKDDSGGKIVFGEDGIPIKGTIPAWVVYGPTMFDQIFDNLEKRIDKIATGFGVRKNKDLKDLIDLPDKPEPKKAKPLLRHVESSEEASEEEPVVEAIPPEALEVPLDELIKLPPRVVSETDEAAPPEEPVEEEVIIEPAEEEVIEEPVVEEPVVEEPVVEEPVVEEPEKKEYYCKHCGEGPFEEPWQLGQHSQNCEKAKAARAAEEEKKGEKKEEKEK